MKKYIYLLAVICVFPLFAQNGTNTLHERIYLQTDKQLYLAGELVWFKLFTVNSDKNPLVFSKIAYIELLDESTSQVQVKIEMSKGVGNGCMELPSNIKTGHYRLVAYTRYMRNENPEVFFEKEIGIVNLFQSYTQENETINTAALQHDENTSNSFSLSTDRTSYFTREQGMLNLTDLPDNIRTLSVSITGKEVVPVSGIHNIQQWDKLSLAPNSKSSGMFLPEYEGHIISGKIVNTQNGKNASSATVVPLLSFQGDQIRLFVGQTDPDSNVSFYTTHVSGTHELITVANNLTEEPYRIDILSPFIQTHTQKQLPVLPIDSAYIDPLLKRNVALQVLYSYTSDSLKAKQFSDAYLKAKPDRTYKLDEYVRFVTMSEVITEFVTEARFRKTRTNPVLEVLPNKNEKFSPALVLLDGIPIVDHSIIYNYNPLLVEKIDLYTKTYMFGGQVFNSIIVFSTYRRNYPDLTFDKSTQIVNYEGTQAPRKFYVPEYANESNRQSRLPDYRHTLLWNPDIQTEGETSIQVPFRTSDFTGEFQVTVEGLTTDGQIIFSTSSFNVD